MKINERQRTIVWLIFLTLFMTGCATITPDIKYKTALPTQKQKNIKVSLTEFQDARSLSQKGVIGQTYNDMGMKAGDVLEPKDLMGGMQKALTDELINAGYQLTNDRKDIVIKASVEAVSCGYQKGINANVRIKFEVFEKNIKVIEHLYSGDSGDLPLFSQDYCGAPLTKCIQDTMTSFVKDLDKYIAS